MLDYKIIENKAPIKIVKNGQTFSCTDLLSETFKKDLTISGNPIIVNEYYVARPDLISQAVYGTDKYADILCKINGISNPFELNENMLVFCPTIDYMTRLIKPNAPASALINKNASPTSGENSNGTSENNVDNKLTNKVEATIEKAEVNLQKMKNERRSPGDQLINDSNYIIDKSLGIVIY